MCGFVGCFLITNFEVQNELLGTSPTVSTITLNVFKGMNIQ